MIETKQKFYNSVGQDITELKEYEARIDELRKEYSFMKKLEDYISRKYEESRTSDSKMASKKAENLAWCAHKLLINFKDLMTKTAIDDRYAWYGGHLSLCLDKNDSLELKLQELGGFFREKFDYLMKKGPYLEKDSNLLEKEQKQKELIVKYIRENRRSYGRNKLFEDEASLYRSYINTLINARGWGGHPEEIERRNKRIDAEIAKLLPHEKYSSDYSTFYDVLYNFRVKTENKVRRRKLTYKEYEHIANTPTEQLFYELTKERGLSLRK